MISFIKNLIINYKKSIMRYENSEYYCCSAIKTSCAIPGFIVYKKIWVLHFYSETTGSVEYYWFEKQEDLEQIIEILNNFGYNFLVKEYEV